MNIVVAQQPKQQYTTPLTSRRNARSNSYSYNTPVSVLALVLVPEAAAEQYHAVG